MESSNNYYTSWAQRQAELQNEPQAHGDREEFQPEE